MLYRGGFRDPLIEQIVEVILREMRAETAAGRLLVQSVAHSLAARLLHRYSSLTVTFPATRLKRPQLDSRRLQRVLAFIEAHIETDITVAQLAAVARLSEFHFSRAFKATTGRSPYRYVVERRLSHARWLLTETDRSLADIADACQFSSAGNLSRAFHRATGTTPAKYRQTQRSKHSPPALKLVSD
jgi:AraC family transcriptional regulator